MSPAEWMELKIKVKKLSGIIAIKWSSAKRNTLQIYKGTPVKVELKWRLWISDQEKKMKRNS